MSRLPSACRLLLAGGLFVLSAFGSRAQENVRSTPLDAAPLALEERGSPSIRSFLPREYGGHNQIWDAAEAPNGLMYFGAHSAVLEFDGLTWRSIPMPGAAFVRGVAIDRDGRIWAGGVNEFGGIAPGPDGRLVFTSLRPQLPPSIRNIGDIRTVHALPDGVYFQSDSTLLRWNGSDLKVWSTDDKFVTLALPWKDRIVVSRNKPHGWVMPTEDGGWAPLDWEPEPRGEIMITHILPDGRDGWWISASRSGLLHYDGKTLTTLEGEIGNYLLKFRLSGTARLPDGRLLFGSYGKGILVTDASLRPLIHLDDTNGLPSNVIIRMEVSRDGIVWLGTENGIARLDFTPGLTRFSNRNGLDSNGVDTVARVDDKLLFATNAGPLELRSGEDALANPNFVAPFPIEDNLNLFKAYDGGILVGGLRRLWWVKDHTVYPIRSPSNIRELHVHSRIPDRLFGLHLGGVVIWRREGVSWVIDHSLDEPRGEFNGLAEDAAGNLWVGSANDGFWRLPYQDITVPADLTTPLPDPVPVHYHEHNGIPTFRDRAVVQSVDDAPLFMTGRGFFRYDKALDAFQPETRYGTRFTDGTSVAYYVTPSPTGGLWIEARDKQPNASNIAFQIGKSIDGHFTPLALPQLGEIGALDSLVAEIVDGDEILWICGRNALLRVNVTRNAAAPSVELGPTLIHSAVTTGGKVLASFREHAPLQVQPGDNSIRFHFGTPGLAGEPDAIHTSRLIGFIDGSEELNNSGERTFTNLPPGHYVFAAQGRGSDFRWSETGRLEFEVLAPWWATSTAKAAYLFAAIIAVYVIVRWRTRRLVRQRAALEQIVAERTAELANKAKALERLHQLEHDETLAARLAAETVRLELLRYQLNPHFLFNSLNSIRALVHTAPASASEMVSKLAEFCRRTLNRGNDEMVTVADEIGMARAYLEIEQVRWQDGLLIKIHVEPSTYDCAIPQNLLLPLLENAIKYGGRTSPDLLEVHLTLRRDDIALVCEVCNTGTWVEPSANPFADSTQIGLQNLRQRIFQHYGANASVAQSIKTGWVIITVRLPVKTNPPPSA